MANEVSEHELKGKVALVTGAGRNIGRMIALTLAAGGAAVVVNARSNRAEAESVAGEIEQRGGHALAAIADVADPTAVEAMITAAVKHFGRIDILVNNAAVRKETPLDEMTASEWREILGVILDGAFNCVKSCLPYLKKSGNGAIINIGGLSGHAGAKNRAHVITAKAGIVGLTRALAHDLSTDRVTVNCVVPGLIDTTRKPGTPLPQHHQTQNMLAGRLGIPEDIAAAVRFLAGPGARYITGQTLHVNGGAYLG
jgi:3-oxoacyl-[acyl-carrier protein] reductase